MTSKRGELLINTLVALVESVTESPRRVLFKGVSDLSESFINWTSQKGLLWEVQVTGSDADVVGARNDASIDTLVVFYQGEVGERESLNAFRLFDEDTIANALIRIGISNHLLPDDYSKEQLLMLNGLLSMVYPSVVSLADFLLDGKANVGKALPSLGLFHDPRLSYSSDLRQWTSRLDDNFISASLRWHDFVDRGLRSQDARRLLGDERLSMIRRSETEPSVRSDILRAVTFDEAIQVLNPPTGLESRLMSAGLRREQASELVRRVKNREINPLKLPADMPSLPETLIQELLKKQPEKEAVDEGNEKEPEFRRVNFCLEALLRLAQGANQLPRVLTISREGTGTDVSAGIEITAEGQMMVSLTSETARLLSTPAVGASELVFQLRDQQNPETILSTFSLENQAGKLDSCAEIWPDEEYWGKAAQIDPKYAAPWSNLQKRVQLLRSVVDPEWQQEPVAGTVEAIREPNNQIYLIFDLVYLANRQLFEDYLDAWLDVASLPWRSATVAEKMEPWRNAVEGLLNLGLAQYGGQDSIVVLPFHPVRLAWHRAVVSKIEGWLADSISKQKPLVFEPAILSDQLEASDRPHAIFLQKKRYLESYHTSFFSLFVPDFRRQRVRAPIERARQKIEQFGRMWPFSLARLHLAFQPGDASDEVYSLLAQHAESQKEAAFSVRAVVESTSEMTAFDQQLFSSGEDTTDLLTREHHESFLPRIEYSKDAGVVENGNDTLQETHIALLVDAFREDANGFEKIVGKINNHPHWTEFGRLLAHWDPESRDEFKKVDLSIPSFHTGAMSNQKRDVVYVPLSGNRPEYLHLLFDSLSAWMKTEVMSEGAYFERVRWDEQSLKRLHDQSDWVVLFDRTLDKAFFQQQLKPAGIKLIDFYPRLPGGYRLSVSSSRTAEVEWQMVQVLHKMFSNEELDLHTTAGKMLDALSEFASGLLLKTLGGGSLAQELLGLYSTYLSLIAEGEFYVGKDWLIPLDNYQEWFGRRTQKGRRADLLVLRNWEPGTLEMLAVESKWYKQQQDVPFVVDEFERDGQMHTAVHSLCSLFDPHQARLDKDYWQKTLYSLLDEAPSTWEPFRQAFHDGQWQLKVDGIVYVHQYTELNQAQLAERSQRLNLEVQNRVCKDQEYFGMGSEFRRLRLISRPEIIQLFKREILK